MSESAIPLTAHLPNVSRLAYGCMGLGGGWNTQPVSEEDVKQTHAVIDTALECGINLFDHADIYTFSKAEQAFGRVLQSAPHLRSHLYIQSKCGIRFADDQGVKRYDFSAKWIEHAVEQILSRLQCGYLDILLLHRPDPLMELDEVARTLETLHHSGKVAHFGVSNMNAHQIHYLQSALNQPIVVNQLEMSLARKEFVMHGIGAGGNGWQPAELDNGTVLYCQSNHIQLQSWGSLARGTYSQPHQQHSDNAVIRQTAQTVFSLAQKYHTSPEAIVLAFLTRHPARIQPIIGTTHLNRIRACADVMTFNLTREDWYALLQSSSGSEVP